MESERPSLASFRRTVEKMRQFRQFYVLTVLPVLVSNWLFWIPMVVLIYCFPTSLQLPLGILACAIWSMLLTALLSLPMRVERQGIFTNEITMAGQSKKLLIPWQGMKC